MEENDEALATNLQLHEKYPRDVTYLYNCGTLLMKVKNDNNAARKMFERVLEFDPKHLNTLVNLGNLLVPHEIRLLLIHLKPYPSHLFHSNSHIFSKRSFLFPSLFLSLFLSSHTLLTDGPAFTSTAYLLPSCMYITFM